MKILKIIIASIGIFFLLAIVGIVILFWNAPLATPIDESYRPIRLIKTGKVDTLEYYTTSYEVGDTITVFRNKTNYSDVADLNNKTGKSEKAVVVDN